MKRTRIDRFKVKSRMASAPTQIGTFEELAIAAELSQTTIYAAIDSYSWRGATLDAIANALGCNSLDLLTIDEVAPAARPGQQTTKGEPVDKSLLAPSPAARSLRGKAALAPPTRADDPVIAAQIKMLEDRKAAMLEQARKLGGQSPK